jgi:antitoxin ParD1/3/4
MSPSSHPQECQRKDALKLEMLRKKIEAGVTALERGDFVEVDETELEDYLERLATSAGSSGDASP